MEWIVGIWGWCKAVTEAVVLCGGVEIANQVIESGVCIFNAVSGNPPA